MGYIPGEYVGGYPLVMHGVGGLIARPEANYLNQIADRLGDGTYVELGTHLGRSAICIADGIRRNNLDAKVVTIDMFDGRELSARFRNAGGDTVTKINRVTSNIEERELKPYIHVVQGLTTDIPDFVDDKIRFLFIDADHSYEGCLGDWLTWRDRVVSEVAFHDSHFPGVTRVLEEEMAGWKKVDQVKSITVWHRGGNDTSKRRRRSRP